MKEHDISNTRIVAVNGHDACDRDIHVKDSLEWCHPQCATTVSHLYAMICFLRDETNTSDSALICEDDLSLEYKQFWTKPVLQYASENTPNDWEILQLAAIARDEHMGDLNVLHAVPRNYPVWYSTCAYLIKREAAHKILKTLGVSIESPRPLVKIAPPPSHYPHAMFADHLLYRICRTYTLPLFTYTAIDSSICPEHVPGQILHKRTINRLWCGSETLP